MNWNSLGVVITSSLSVALSVVAAPAHESDRSDSVDPFAAVPRTHYHPIITDYRATPIMTKPANWRELNDRAKDIGGPRGQLRRIDEPIRKRKKK